MLVTKVEKNTEYQVIDPNKGMLVLILKKLYKQLMQQVFNQSLYQGLYVTFFLQSETDKRNHLPLGKALHILNRTRAV